MGKLFRRVMVCLLAVACFWCGSLLADRQRLNESLIRFHVVADSNEAEAQANKLLVRDAVVAYLGDTLSSLCDRDAAEAYLRENLLKIQELANDTLRAAGCEDRAVVSFDYEEFATKAYDTFSLPAGIYEALRITIGNGAGENWWCVAFPSLCFGEEQCGFADRAAAAGFPESLSSAMAGEEQEKLRFYFLEKLGQLESFLRTE